MLIPASKFVFHFYSDGSRNDWGYRITVTPRNDAAAVDQSMQRISQLARLHKSLCYLSNADPTVRAVDESLILYLETKKADKVETFQFLKINT